MGAIVADSVERVDGDRPPHGEAVAWVGPSRMRWPHAAHTVTLIDPHEKRGDDVLAHRPGPLEVRAVAGGRDLTFVLTENAHTVWAAAGGRRDGGAEPLARQHELADRASERALAPAREDDGGGFDANIGGANGVEGGHPRQHDGWGTRIQEGERSQCSEIWVRFR